MVKSRRGEIFQKIVKGKKTQNKAGGMMICWSSRCVSLHLGPFSSLCHTYLNIITPSDPPPTSLSYHPSLSAVIPPLLLLLLSTLLPLIFIPFSLLQPSISAPSLKSSQLHPRPASSPPSPPTRHLLIRGAAQEKWISSLPAFPPFRTLDGCLRRQF